MTSKAFGGLVLAALISGCTTMVERVDHQMLLQPGTRTYELDPLELFVMPMELEAPLPSFPGDVAVGNESIVVCAEIWLSVAGDVTHVAALRDAPGCPAADDAIPASFEQVVVDSAQHWSFSPAMICRFRPDQRDKRESGDCRGDVEVQRVPVRLAYAFEFLRRDGRIAVAPRRLSD